MAMGTWVGIGVIFCATFTMAALFDMARRSVDKARREGRLQAGWTLRDR